MTLLSHVACETVSLHVEGPTSYTDCDHRPNASSLARPSAHLSFLQIPLCPFRPEPAVPSGQSPGVNKSWFLQGLSILARQGSTDSLEMPQHQPDGLPPSPSVSRSLCLFLPPSVSLLMFLE